MRHCANRSPVFRWYAEDNAKRCALDKGFEFFCTPQRLGRHKALPSRFERLELTAPYGPLTGFALGPPDGAPVLMVHGWHAHSELCLPPIQACARHGLRVYAFDMPAHGQSRDLNPEKATTNLVEWVETLALLGPSLGIAKWHAVVTHSFGGLATSFAIGPRPWSQTQPLQTKALAMMACTAGMPQVMESYRRQHDATDADMADVECGIVGVGRAPSSALTMRAVADHLPPRVLLVHDPDDPMARWQDLRREFPRPCDEFLRPGAGHDGILFQLDTARAIAKFVAL